MVQDLKQFITATMSQLMADVATKDDTAALNTLIDTVEQRWVHALTSSTKTRLHPDAIADTVTHANDVTNAKLQVHEQHLERLDGRVERLEHRAA